MPRKQRSEYPGAIFHIWIRRVDRLRMFVFEADWRSYVALLEEAATLFGWDVIEFCLMPNHVHLLLRISEPNLGAGMQHIHANFVPPYNTRHGRSGRLFERRFQWKAVVDEIYLATVREYIAENPVRAKLCDCPDDWPWSSRGVAGRWANVT